MPSVARGENERRVSRAGNALPRARLIFLILLLLLSPPPPLLLLPLCSLPSCSSLLHLASLLLFLAQIYTSFSCPAPSGMACPCRPLRCLICIQKCLLSASQFPQFHHPFTFPPQASRVFTLLSIPLLTCLLACLPASLSVCRVYDRFAV